MAAPLGIRSLHAQLPLSPLHLPCSPALNTLTPAPALSFAMSHGSWRSYQGASRHLETACLECGFGTVSADRASCTCLEGFVKDSNGACSKVCAAF